MENTTTVLRKAARQQAKLRIGVSGPSGSGKTYSQLLIAKGLASDMSKVAVIDTENGSADLYSHLGDYNVLPLQAPYAPERYIAAIRECELAGMEVIIIDSISHEWDGKGGCLEINEKLGQTKFKGNNWAAWSETTPRHQKFIDALVSSPCHILTTVRSKTDTVQTDDKKIKKVGTKEIQREGFEYELTLNFNLDRDGHYAIASKDRTEIFIHSDPFVITEETGKTLLKWANSGVAPLPVKDIAPVQPIAPSKPALDPIASAKHKIMVCLEMLLGKKPTDPTEIADAIKRFTDLDIKDEKPDYEEMVSRLEVCVKENRENVKNAPVSEEAPKKEETTAPAKTRAPRKKTTTTKGE